MAVLDKAEASLATIFKDLPQLPDSTKEGLAKVWPWLALVGGVIQLFAALALWRLASWADRINEAGDALSAYYTSYAVGPSGLDKTIIYLGAVLLLVEAVLLLMAFSKLQKRQQAGWRLLFVVALLNLAYAVLQIFTFQRGFGSFIFSLIGSGIVFYLLFQIREKFKK